METLASPAAISRGSGRASKSLRLEECPIQDRCCSWKKGTEIGRFIFLRRSLSGFWIFRKWGERREGRRLRGGNTEAGHKGRLNLAAIDFRRSVLLFQRNIKVRHTGTRAHLCKSRPCRMQNGTSVASPFPNVSQKKRGEGKKNIIMARMVARRVLGRVADSGIVKGEHRWDPTSPTLPALLLLHYSFERRCGTGRERPIIDKDDTDISPALIPRP